MIRAFRFLVVPLALAILVSCGSSKPSYRMTVYDGPPVTQVVVNKGDRRMHLLHGTTVLKSYDVALGNEPIGAKRIEGDGKTPEGIYFIDRFNPRSRYHLSVGISYPSQTDKLRAELVGMRPGGDIFIHGRGPEGRAANLTDWTAGCIAVDDDEIEEIYAMLRPGVPIVINP